MRPIYAFLSAFTRIPAAFAQTAPARLEFEVASVKPSAALVGGSQVNVGVRINGAQLHISSLALRDYIRIAYRVKEYQVFRPRMADRRALRNRRQTTRFGATREQVPDMLQSLLADRFGLKLHHGTKELPVYALVVAAGGVKMKEVPPDPDAAAAAAAPVEVVATGGPQGVSMNFGRGSTLDFGNNKFEAHKMPMPGLADALGRYVDRPVIDMTGLTARYDFTIPLTAEDYRALLIRSAVAAGVSLPPEALRLLDGAADESLHSALRALGLKLDARKAPLDVLVIDHVNKTPTEN